MVSRTWTRCRGWLCSLPSPAHVVHGQQAEDLRPDNAPSAYSAESWDSEKERTRRHGIEGRSAIPVRASRRMGWRVRAYRLRRCSCRSRPGQPRRKGSGVRADRYRGRRGGTPVHGRCGPRPAAGLSVTADAMQPGGVLSLDDELDAWVEGNLEVLATDDGVAGDPFIPTVEQPYAGRELRWSQSFEGGPPMAAISYCYATAGRVWTLRFDQFDQEMEAPALETIPSDRHVVPRDRTRDRGGCLRRKEPRRRAVPRARAFGVGFVLGLVVTVPAIFFALLSPVGEAVLGILTPDRSCSDR